MYWAQRCRHVPFPSVSDALGDLHREHFIVTLSLHQNSLKHRWFSLDTGHIPNPRGTNSVVYSSLCQKKVDKLLINTLV